MAKTLYYNGTILTMTGNEPQTVEAVLTENGKILAAGSRRLTDEKINSLPDGGGETIFKDLKGAVMLPGFIDSHSHISAVARVLSFALLHEAESFDAITDTLKKFRDGRDISPGAWLIGTGYDHNKLKERRHPNRFVLDAAFPENPVLISHVSGHMGVANSLALKIMGITADTKNPAGGRIGRKGKAGPSAGKYGEPDGYLEETAFTASSSVIPEPGSEQITGQLKEAESLYLRQGITTVQDGRAGREEWKLLKYAAEHRLFHVDVVTYIPLNDAPELASKNPSYTNGYNNHLRIGGYKIFLDGSPQGRTAWMSLPYEGEPAGYCGYPIFKDMEVIKYCKTALLEGRQLLVHCNGDAAASQMIDSLKAAWEETGIDPSGIRPVMIHAQLVREDQLKAMKELSITASFFTAHTYYWGDIHLKNFGESRALKISPARSALDKGVNVTFHQDSPVIPPDMLETIWCAVNRISREGKSMGAAERVTPYEALKAVTINAAFQYGEEKEKGTIEPEKTADFVILSDNPLTVNPLEIKKIRVLETIKSGKVLYSGI